ncbi:MAG: DUF1926 domain-containing protein [Proteobacteria bacterium]|nr:DUF1926 domain-containing protein [Pseudomonadota bacterium]MCP4915558.1 DUF1926 domain-containing protein [Pseudomonadota bacterium]
MSQIRFLPVLHMHVPVGLTERDRKHAYEQWFEPVFRSLRARPQLALTLHLSGYLVRWLGLRKPDALKLLGELRQKGRVELLLGGWADPFLSGIPKRDAVAQIQLQGRIVESRCGARPTGAYLAEGAWDPHLPSLLAAAGIEYAFVPGEAFLAAGVRPSRLSGWYLTEREGHMLRVLPTDPQLDVLIGPGKPSQAMELLQARRSMGMDHISWVASVESLAHIVGSRYFSVWWAAFLDALEGQSHWLRTTTPSRVLSRTPCAGRVYLPSWIPARLAEASTGIAEATLTQADGGRRCPYTRAGTWEGLLTRYEEGNRIHKRMMQASDEVQRLKDKLAAQESPDAVRLRALEHACLALYRAQGSGVYWSGPRGGIYEPALRAGAYGNLCEAESLVSRTLGEAARIRSFRQDLDCDGTEEVLVRTPHFGAVINPDQGGSVIELGSWTLPGNVLDVMARRDEPWHQELDAHSLLPSLVLEVEEPSEVTESYELFVPHDDDDSTVLAELQRDEALSELANHYAVDEHGRGAFVDHFFGEQVSLENLQKNAYPEEGDFAYSPYSVVTAIAEGPRKYRVLLTREGRVVRNGEDHLVQIRKQYTFLRDRPAVEVGYSIVNRSNAPVRGRFAVEVNLGASSSKPGAARLVIDGCDEVPVSEAGFVEQVDSVALIDSSRKLKVTLSAEQQPGDLWHYPVNTVRRGGPVGLELSYQGVCLIVSWPVQLWGEEKRLFRLRLTVESNGRR